MSFQSNLPGVTGPGGPDPQLEWVRPGPGVLGKLAARLGSEARADELVVAVMKCLRPSLAADTWDAIADELPYALRATLRAPGERPVERASTRRELFERVGTLVQHPPARAAFEVAAVFATLAAALPRALADAVASDLPEDVAELWRRAR